MARDSGLMVWALGRNVTYQYPKAVGGVVKLLFNLGKHTGADWLLGL